MPGRGERTPDAETMRQWNHRHERLENELEQARHVIQVATQTSPPSSADGATRQFLRSRDTSRSPYRSNGLPMMSRRELASRSMVSPARDRHSLNSAHTDEHRKSKNSLRFTRRNLMGEDEDVQLQRYSGGLNMNIKKNIQRRIQEDNSRLYQRLKGSKSKTGSFRSIKEQVDYYRQLMLRSGPNRELYKRKVRDLERRLPKRKQPSWTEIMEKKVHSFGQLTLGESTEKPSRPWK